MWDTYAKTDQDSAIGEFSRPKPKAELICGVPYTGLQRPFKRFFVQIGHETTEWYASGGNHHKKRQRIVPDQSLVSGVGDL